MGKTKWLVSNETEFFLYLLHTKHSMSPPPEKSELFFLMSVYETQEHHTAGNLMKKELKTNKKIDRLIVLSPEFIEWKQITNTTFPLHFLYEKVNNK